MKLINLLIIVLIAFCTTNTYAQGLPQYVEEGKISIDGKDSDWSGVKAVFDDFGSKTNHKNLIDVQATKLAFSNSNLFFHMKTNKELGKWKPQKPISAFQIYFDVDVEQATGNTEIKVYDIAKIKGNEFRIEVFIEKSGKVLAKLYSKSQNFNKEISSWDASKSFKTNGNNLEFKIPLETLNILSEGTRQVRFLFAEFSTSQKDHSYKGFKKVTYALNFASSKSAAQPSTDSSEAASSGGFGLSELMIITIWIVAMLCSFAIVPKAGLSTSLALVNIIPVFGQLAFLFILAFNKWPLHKDYNTLENRLKELETQDEY